MFPPRLTPQALLEKLAAIFVVVVVIRVGGSVTSGAPSAAQVQEAAYFQLRNFE